MTCVPSTSSAHLLHEDAVTTGHADGDAAIRSRVVMLEIADEIRTVSHRHDRQIVGPFAAMRIIVYGSDVRRRRITSSRHGGVQ